MTMTPLASSVSASSSTEFNNDVEQILLNVESREPMAIITNNTTNSNSDRNNSSHGRNNNDSYTSKLSIQELEQLTILSTSSSATTNHKSTSSSSSSIIDATTIATSSQYKTGWATVNIDSLCDLCQLLENHIQTASRVDYIKFAREAFDAVYNENNDMTTTTTTSKNKKKKKKRKSSTGGFSMDDENGSLEQVRLDGWLDIFF
jgi:hypothetical protein